MTDKCRISCSPLGWYSKPWENYIIPILDSNGNLNESRVHEICRDAADGGANTIREFPWWIWDASSMDISPFEKHGMSINHQYFRDQRKIAEIVNSYDVVYCIELFDHCGTKKGPGQFSPWNIFSNYFYGADSKAYRITWIELMLKTFGGLKVDYGLCNEPGLNKATPRFLADTFVQLVKSGIKPSKIILGIDYGLKENNSKWKAAYKDFRELITAELSRGIFARMFTPNWPQRIKSKCLSPVHNSTIANFRKMFGVNVPAGGTRNTKHSKDGVRNRPGARAVEKWASYILKQKHKAAHNGLVNFEVVYGKQKGDPIDSVKGISEAYKKFFGNYPENYGKFPEVLENKDKFQVIVEHAYLGILGRKMDPAGMTYVEDLREGGLSIFGVCKELVDSIEGEKAIPTINKETELFMLNRLYNGIFEHDIDPDSVRIQAMVLYEPNGVARLAASLLEALKLK